MEWVLIVVGAILGLLLIATAIGAALHGFHRAISTAHFRARPETIWALVSDLPAYPSWRTDLRAVERAPDHRGHPVWVEVSRRGGMRMPLEVEEIVPPRRLVLRIADQKLSFGGAWTIEIQPREGGSVVQTTEDGEIKNPLFRFFAKVVFGHHATMNAYLRMLGKKLGEDVRVVER